MAKAAKGCKARIGVKKGTCRQVVSYIQIYVSIDKVLYEECLLLETQSFEKTRDIEASLLQKLRIRSSTESNVRWSSDPDSLQGDEQ